MNTDEKQKQEFDPRILALCKEVTAKRARTVIDHILAHGFITTEELKETYGYDHPPRAIRDVRENGIPLKTYTVVSNTTGRKIAGYTFDDPSKISSGRIGGRKAFSRQFKENLIDKYSSKCTITGEIIEPRYLQIDHRIPYEIAGDSSDFDNLDEYMLLDASAQRAKSWSCEHCENFTAKKERVICNTCFWAYPENYQHIAMMPHRRLDLLWTGNDIQQYENLKQASEKENISIKSLVKTILKKAGF